MSRSVFRPRSSSKRQIHELEQNLLQILCIPLLLFLHLIFIASSLLLRLVQNFGDDHGELQRPRTKASPKHVALTLLLQIPSLKDKSPGVKNRSWSGSRLWNRVRWEVATSFGTSSVKPSRRDVRKRKVEREAIVESVKRLVKWAGEEGVTELSIWDDIGLLESCSTQLEAALQKLPTTPSDSRSPSPPRTISQAITPPPYSGPSTPPQTLSPDPSEREEPHEPMTYAEAVKTRDQPGHAVHTDSTHLTVLPSPRGPAITIHLLSPDTADELIASLARDYSYRDLSQEDITQSKLDEDIRSSLQFQNDPDLLIVHPLYPPSFLRALLPRPPPELGGYPFWSLRLTEIYHHSQPVPLPRIVVDALEPLLSRARVSSPSLFRKIARAISPLRKRGDERVRGSLERDEWVGAMRAWEKVEQRRGK